MDSFMDISTPSDMDALSDIDFSSDLTTLFPIGAFSDTSSITDWDAFSDIDDTGYFSDLESLPDTDALYDPDSLPVTKMKESGKVLASADSLQSDKDFARDILDFLVEDILAEYDDEAVYDTVNDRIDHLHAVYQDLAACYAHELSPAILPNYFDFYAQILEGRERIAQDISRIEAGTSHYDINLAILLGEYESKASRLMALGVAVFRTMPGDVVDAISKLKNITGSATLPLDANPTYLTDIATFWRTHGGLLDRSLIQPIYDWVRDPFTTMITNIDILAHPPPSPSASAAIHHALASLASLPTTLAADLEAIKDDIDFTSVDARLGALHALRDEYVDYYMYIVHLHGITPHRVGPLPGRGHGFTHPELHFTTPWYIAALYTSLLAGHRAVVQEYHRVDAARRQYRFNLSTLYYCFLEKVGSSGTSMFETYSSMERDVIEAAGRLERMLALEWIPTWQGHRASYLYEIARFWRTVGGRGDRVGVERVWEWVAGGPLRME